MTQDLNLVQDENGTFDLEIVGADFGGVNGMETAVDVTIFTDSRADSSQVPEPTSRRGYIGDILTSREDRSLGSVMWLYNQSRLTPDDLNGMRNDLKLAFNWVIKDNIARSVSVEVIKTGIRRIKVTVFITTLSGLQQKYTRLWSLTGAN